MDKLTLPKIHFPRISMPHVALTGHDITHEASHETLIIPSSIRSAMVVWYSPKRQGCTNEGMAAKPMLKDLSGNGLDMTCYNFAWNGESGIAEDGSLAFDGVDDFGMADSEKIKTALNDDFTIIIRYKNNDNPATSRSCLASNAQTPQMGAFIIDVCEGRWAIMQEFSYGNSNTLYVSNFTPKEWRMIYVTPNSYNGELVMEKGSSHSSGVFFLGSVRSSDDRCLNGNISSVLLFDRTLIQSEIDWVKSNLID